MNWLIARLSESSTWRGLIWLLTVAGVALNPEQTEALIVAGMAVAGALGVFTKDSNDHDTRLLPKIELQGRPDRAAVEYGVAEADPRSADRDGAVDSDVSTARLRDVQSDGKSDSGWGG